ncbi:MAG: hypothetical protein QM737_07205 [Ferruginibacter sp.]
MQLEEMKTMWGVMSEEIEKQKTLTQSLIIKMTQSNYRTKINNILLPELISTLGCFVWVFYILINLEQFDKWYLLTCGVIAVALLIIMPVISLKAVYKIRHLNITGNNVKQSLHEYSKGKLRFVFIQKLSFYLGAILLVVIVPVTGKLIAKKDLFIETNLWLWYGIGFIFFYLFAKWVFKKYSRSVNDAENILKELDA